MHLISDIKKSLDRLSLLAMGRTWPNPSVGAYLLCRTTSGELFALEGYTEKPGSRHAEIVLLDKLDRLRREINKAILFVTLEPCSTHGRTPPCTNRILQYDFLKTVIVMNRDPLMSGEGIRILKENGKKIIEPEKTYIPDKSDPFLGGFLSRVTHTGPRLHLKAAVMSDSVLGSRKERIYISGNQALRFGMALRAKMDAVLVGPGAIAVDYPGLNLRKDEKHTGDIAFEKIKGKDRFTDALLENIKEIETLNLDDKDYQPDRIFILDRHFENSMEFYDKQKKLENSTGRKSVFLTTETSQHIWTGLEIDGILPDFNSPFFTEKLRNTLSDRGYNEVLVEGGAGIFNLFSAQLKKHDRFYILRSKKTFSGNKPDAVYLPEFMQKRSSIAEYRLGEDDLIVS